MKKTNIYNLKNKKSPFTRTIRIINKKMKIINKVIDFILSSSNAT